MSGGNSREISIYTQEQQEQIGSILNGIVTPLPSSQPEIPQSNPIPRLRSEKEKLSDKAGTSFIVGGSLVMASLAAAGAAALWTAEETGLTAQLIEALRRQVNPHTLELPENPLAHPEIIITSQDEPKAAETTETAVEPPIEMAQNPFKIIFEAPSRKFTFAARQPETQTRYTFQLPLLAEQGLAEYAEKQGYPSESAERAVMAPYLSHSEFYNSQGDGFNPALQKHLEAVRDYDPQQAQQLAELYSSWIAGAHDLETAKRFALLAGFYDQELGSTAVEQYRQALEEALAREAAEDQARAQAEAQAAAAEAQAATASTAADPQISPRPEPQLQPQPQPQATKSLIEQNETASSADKTPAQTTFPMPEIKFGLGWSPVAVAQSIEGMLNLAGLAEREQGLPFYTVISCEPLTPGFEICWLAGQRVTFVVLPTGLVSAGSILTGRSLADLAVQGLRLLQ